MPYFSKVCLIKAYFFAFATPRSIFNLVRGVNTITGTSYLNFLMYSIATDSSLGFITYCPPIKTKTYETSVIAVTR
ncbi:hypothetical protein, partial [Thermofilum sp.]|uniref:hypothetical protein n=1 Tax=Thermofilum sp. TaxID=1961369 RepID=UPI00258C9D57